MLYNSLTLLIPSNSLSSAMSLRGAKRLCPLCHCEEKATKQYFFPFKRRDCHASLTGVLQWQKGRDCHDRLWARNDNLSSHCKGWTFLSLRAWTLKRSGVAISYFVIMHDWEAIPFINEIARLPEGKPRNDKKAKRLPRPPSACWQWNKEEHLFI